MATQNPIEQEGTYPLPEAQIDRFMLHLAVDYPDRATTLKIMRLARDEAMSQLELAPPTERLTQAQVFSARSEALRLQLADSVAEYIAALVDATRRPQAYSPDLKQWLRWGVSPRAAIAMERGARAVAWLDGRDYVEPGRCPERRAAMPCAIGCFWITAPRHAASPPRRASMSCCAKVPAP